MFAQRAGKALKVNLKKCNFSYAMNLINMCKSYSPRTTKKLIQLFHFKNTFVNKAPISHMCWFFSRHNIDVLGFLFMFLCHIAYPSDISQQSKAAVEDM